MSPSDFANILEVVIIALAVVSIMLVVSKKTKYHIPLFGGKKELFRYEMIDESNEKSVHTIPVKDLEVLGKFTYFRYRRGIYFIKNWAIFRVKGQRSSIYRLHDSNPLPINRTDKTPESAEETKEMADSKVVIDLLTYTLSKTDVMIFLAVAIIGVVSVINLYFTYTLSGSIGTENNLLQQVVHYLFPNSAPAT